MTRLTSEDPRLDFHQLRVLVKTMVRCSFRGHESIDRGLDRSIRSGFFNMVLTYFLTSIALCAIAVICRNQITYNALIISYGMIMTSFAVLIEYSDLLLSTDDSEVLFARPLSSKTVYLARLVSLSLFVLIYSTALLLLPTIASFRFSPDKWVLIPVSFLIKLLASLVSALFLVSLYMQFLRRLSPVRLSRVLTCFQVGFSFLLFFGYYKFLLYKEAEGPVSVTKAVENVQSALATGSNPFSLALDQLPFFSLLPPAWFAGCISLLTGEVSGKTIALSACALGASLAVFLVTLKGASSEYQQRLMASLQSSPLRLRGSRDTAKALYRAAFFCQRNVNGWIHPFAGMIDARVRDSLKVGFHLVNRYMGRDARLRRGILPFFGIMLFYLLYGWDNDHFLMNIFQADSILDVMGAHSFFVMLPLCVLIATNATKFSTDWSASWILHVAPLDLRGLHFGYQLAVFVRIYAPVWLVLAAYYSFKMPLRPLFWQMSAVLLTILLIRSLSFHFDLHLPLSEPPRVHAGFMKFSLVMVFLILVVQAILVLEYLNAKSSWTLLLMDSLLLLLIVASVSAETRRLRAARQ